MVIKNWGIFPEANELTVEQLREGTEHLSIIDR